MYNVISKKVMKYMNIKNLIKSRRKELGLTLADIAKACGVSEATVSRWESGNIDDMKRSRIASLSKVLKISPSIIVGSEEDDDKDFIWGNDAANREYLKDKPELEAIYNELVNREDIYILFDKTKDLEPKDVESVLMFVQTIRKQRGMDED